MLATVTSDAAFRYAFRSEEKVALQEIGPRFTLKLRSLRKGLPAVQDFGEAPKVTEIQVGDMEAQEEARDAAIAGGQQEGGGGEAEDAKVADGEQEAKKIIKPPTQDEFLWVWKVRFRLTLLPRSILIDHPSLSWKRRGEHSFYSLVYYCGHQALCGAVRKCMVFLYIFYLALS